jgi:hypothetical protein
LKNTLRNASKSYQGRSPILVRPSPRYKKWAILSTILFPARIIPKILLSGWPQPLVAIRRRRTTPAVRNALFFVVEKYPGHCEERRPPRQRSRVATKQSVISQPWSFHSQPTLHSNPDFSSIISLLLYPENYKLNPEYGNASLRRHHGVTFSWYLLKPLIHIGSIWGL